MFSVHRLNIRVVRSHWIRSLSRNRVGLITCSRFRSSLGRVRRLNYIRLRCFFEGKHFVSESLHCLKHGRLEDPHFLFKLDVKCTTQGFFKPTFYFILQCSTWSGWEVCGVFNDKDSKRKGWGRGGEENKLSAAPSRSASEPEKASPSSHNRSRSSLLVFKSDAFCFLIYRCLCLIFICCSSVKLEQILQEGWLVTQGSSPLPDSLQVGQ